MSNQPKQFVVLSISRSGTSALIEALATHPDVIVHGEIFHEKTEWHIHAEFLATHDIKQRETDPVGFVKEILRSNFGRRVVGFKMWRPQSEVACDYVLGNPDVVKIILERNNRLAAFSSGQLARRTQVWNVRGLQPLENSDFAPRLEFNVKAFRRFVQVHNELFALYRAGAKGTVVDLTYEDVATLRIGEVLDALEIQPFAVQHQMQRLHASNILSRFEPSQHETIMAELSRIGRGEWEYESF